MTVPLLYPAVAQLLQVSPVWRGFDDCEFQVYVLPIDEVLGDFFTCWGAPPGTLTLDEHFDANGGPNKDVSALAASFDFSRPVLVIAFSRTVLNARWADKYAIGGAERVIVDGNHRLGALAVLRTQGERYDVPVGAFVCH